MLEANRNLSYLLFHILLQSQMHTSRLSKFEPQRLKDAGCCACGPSGIIPMRKQVSAYDAHIYDVIYGGFHSCTPLAFCKRDNLRPW